MKFFIFASEKSLCILHGHIFIMNSRAVITIILNLALRSRSLCILVYEQSMYVYWTPACRTGGLNGKFLSNAINSAYLSNAINSRAIITANTVYGAKLGFQVQQSLNIGFRLEELWGFTRCL